MSETLLQRFDRQAKSLIGWPYCTCGSSDYRTLNIDGVLYAQPTGMIQPKRKWCRHREITHLLIRAYRIGKAKR